MALETRRYVAAPADLPRGTLVQLFLHALTRELQDAMRWSPEPGKWLSLSHAEIRERVRRLALFLRSQGIQRGDRVAILSENRPEWAISDYACLCIGAIPVPIYGTLPPGQVKDLLADSGTRAIFVSNRAQLDKIREIRGALPDLELTVAFEDADLLEGELRLADALARGRMEEDAGRGRDFETEALKAQPDDVATIIYTSGTTGEPKGVMLTHQNIFSNTEAVREVLPFTPEDVALSFLPLSHILQRMVDHCLFGRGVTLAYVGAFDAVAQALVEVHPTVVVSTPRVYEKVYAAMLSGGGLKHRLVVWARDVGLRWADVRLRGERPSHALALQHRIADRLVYAKLRERIGGRLRYFLSGGAPLSPELARFFYAAGVMILEGYGLTETSPVTNVNTPEAMRVGTVGKPVPGTEIMIANDGEILIRGPQVMKGYYGKEDATREAIDAEGWFHTGDIGEIDADGFLRITDRKKDLIVTAGGKKIAPQPIENLLKTNRFIGEAVVLGDRHPYAVVLIVPDFSALGAWAEREGIRAENREALLREMRVRRMYEREVFGMLRGLARFETPKKIALLPREFSIESGELTPKLSVKRRVVEAHYRDVLEELYRDSADVVVPESAA